jgi:hypothetical protein
MSETLKERLDNLRMFLQELSNDKFSYIYPKEIRDQASYHLATMDLLNEMLERTE